VDLGAATPGGDDRMPIERQKAVEDAAATAVIERLVAGHAQQAAADAAEEAAEMAAADTFIGQLRRVPWSRLAGVPGNGLVLGLLLGFAAHAMGTGEAAKNSEGLLAFFPLLVGWVISAVGALAALVRREPRTAVWALLVLFGTILGAPIASALPAN